jgi:DoxX-like family
MNTSALDITPQSGKALRIGLWVAQVLTALMFAFIGFSKLTTPIPELAAMMKWPGEYSPAFVRWIGAVDLLGGIGLLLPSATRILPRLSVLAALGCTVLQVLAIAFHVSRGEFMVLPLNAVLIALCIFVLWGRATKLPIAART